MFKRKGRHVYQLFVSHCWHQRVFYRDLLDLLHERQNFTFIDRSVPSERRVPGSAAEVWDQIRAQICVSDVVLVINTVAATRSEWIRRELHAAERFGMRIIGVTPDARRAERPSSIVANVASEVVSWRADSIVEAIKRGYRDRAAADHQKWVGFKRRVGLD